MKKKILTFIITGLLLGLIILVAMANGSIKLSYEELFKGLFIAYDERVAIIYDLRFPRIIIAVVAGAAIAASSVLFQSVMKNPLADPSIIGVSAGANLATFLVALVWPKWYFASPLFASLGGLLACLLVYSLSWRSGLAPLRLILVGIAINSIFSGLMEAINSFGGTSSASSMMGASIAMKTWADVRVMSIYAGIGLICALGCIRACNLLALEDKTARGLGINVNGMRLYVSVTAVMLASIATAIVGVVAFLGLIAAHIARYQVGSNHKWLLPYAMLVGSFLLVLADTMGRLIAAPYEIAPSILCAIVGGPCLIILLRKSDRLNEN